jgi:catechol-2,3-dioxygenase
MTVFGIQHFNIRVSKSELALVQRFYIEVVGLRLGPRPNLPSVGAWLYAGEAPIIHLTQMNSGETVPPGASENLPANIYDRKSALDHIALMCSGLDDMRRRLERNGIAYTCAEVPVSGAVQLFVRDPSGVGIELIFAAEDCAAAKQSS